MRQFWQQRSLLTSDEEVLKKLKAYSAEMKDTVQAKARSVWTRSDMRRILKSKAQTM